jgi:hypothetical protein
MKFSAHPFLSRKTVYNMSYSQNFSDPKAGPAAHLRLLTIWAFLIVILR